MTMTVREMLEKFPNFEGTEMAIGVDTAIKSLRPFAKFILNNTKFINYECPMGTEPPEWSEVIDELERQKQVSAYYKYVYARSKEYPHGYQQLEMIWDAVDKGIDLKNSEWYKTIKEIKEKHPKPESSAPE
jgi:hypothetical protein